MKTFLLIIFSLLALQIAAQKKKARVPSYFGLRVSPIFPTEFIGAKSLSLSEDSDQAIRMNTTITQKIGYSFGCNVRAGLTKFISLETGINFNQRSFNVTMDLPDSSISASNDISFVSYDVPINALFYIKLAENWFINASLGVAVTFAPSDIGILTSPKKKHIFRHAGLVDKKVGAELNANLGFEFRTRKDGIFYIGGSARVPFKPLFEFYMQYNYTSSAVQQIIHAPIDGSYLSLDFKYFFPNIKNKGVQFQDGPIEQ